MRAPGARRGSAAWWRLWLRARGTARPTAPHDTPLPWRRRLAHAAIVLAGWLLFVWCWRVVTADHPSIGQLSDLLIGALVVVPVFTVSWVVHNVGIHRRKGPRRSVPAVEQRYERDYNGRVIQADWAALAGAQRINVVIDGDSKRFVAVVGLSADASQASDGVLQQAVQPHVAPTP